MKLKTRNNKTRERYIRRRKKRNKYYIELEEIEDLFNKLIVKMYPFMEGKYLDKAGTIYLLECLESLIERKAKK